MKTVGVGVEGPSDQRFWRKVLHRSFPECRFDVHNMCNRQRLIRESGRLLGSFRAAKYKAGILILDIDDDPCVAELLTLFDQDIRGQLRVPLEQRFLFLAIARRKIESWFLADREAIVKALGKADYLVPEETEPLGKGRIKELCRAVGRGYNEIEFAEALAPMFDVERAKRNSSSLSISWERIATAVERASG